jgi:hypothetical protein
MNNLYKTGFLFLSLVGCQNITQQQYDWAVQANVKLREEVATLKKQSGKCEVPEKETVKNLTIPSKVPSKQGEKSIQSEGPEEVAAHLGTNATSAEAKLDAAVEYFKASKKDIDEKTAECLKWIVAETFDPPLNERAASKLCSESADFMLEKKDLNYIACVNRFIASPAHFYWGDIETDCLKDSSKIPPTPSPK